MPQRNDMQQTITLFYGLMMANALIDWFIFSCTLSNIDPLLHHHKLASRYDHFYIIPQLVYCACFPNIPAPDIHGHIILTGTYNLT